MSESKLHHLFSLQNKSLVNDAVVMVVAEKPVIEGTFVFDYLQKTGQAIRLVTRINPRRDTIWSAVREYGDNNFFFVRSAGEDMPRILVIAPLLKTGIFVSYW